MKFAFLAVSALALAATSNASASQIKGTPYTFTGSVVTATAGCPYAAKAKLAGYTLINFTNEYVFQGHKYVEKPVIAVRWSRNFGQSVKLFPFERRTGFYGQGYAEAIHG